MTRFQEESRDAKAGIIRWICHDDIKLPGPDIGPLALCSTVILPSPFRLAPRTVQSTARAFESTATTSTPSARKAAASETVPLPQPMSKTRSPAAMSIAP